MAYVEFSLFIKKLQKYYPDEFGEIYQVCKDLGLSMILFQSNDEVFIPTILYEVIDEISENKGKGIPGDVAVNAWDVRLITTAYDMVKRRSWYVSFFLFSNEICEDLESVSDDIFGIRTFGNDFWHYGWSSVDEMLDTGINVLSDVMDRVVKIRIFQSDYKDIDEWLFHFTEEVDFWLFFKLWVNARGKSNPALRAMEDLIKANLDALRADSARMGSNSNENEHDSTPWE